MFAAAVVDLGMMLLSAVLDAQTESAIVMVFVIGAIPALAVAIVGVIARRNSRGRWRSAKPSSELTRLATRIDALAPRLQ